MLFCKSVQSSVRRRMGRGVFPGAEGGPVEAFLPQEVRIGQASFSEVSFGPQYSGKKGIVEAHWYRAQ